MQPAGLRFTGWGHSKAENRKNRIFGQFLGFFSPFPRLVKIPAPSSNKISLRKSLPPLVEGAPPAPAPPPSVDDPSDSLRRFKLRKSGFSTDRPRWCKFAGGGGLQSKFGAGGGATAGAVSKKNGFAAACSNSIGSALKAFRSDPDFVAGSPNSPPVRISGPNSPKLNRESSVDGLGSSVLTPTRGIGGARGAMGEHSSTIGELAKTIFRFPWRFRSASGLQEKAAGEAAAVEWVDDNFCILFGHERDLKKFGNTNNYP